LRVISNKLGLLVFFILSPLLSLFIALKSYRTSWAKNIMWAFVVFYGLTFVISNEGMDAFEYAKKLTEMHQSNLSFSELSAKAYTDEEGGGLDFIQPLLTYFVSLFTDNYHILYGVFCIVFGFFYSRNLWFLIDGLKGQIKPQVLFFLFLFAMIIPLWMVNGVRMWTAALIFFYGALPFLLYKTKKSLIWCVVAIFMHFSFMFPLAIMGLFILLGNRAGIYFWLFVFSFFFKQLDLTAANNLMQSYLPSIFQARVQGYTNTEYVEINNELISGNNFYVLLYEPLLNWTITSLLILAYWKGKQFFEKNQRYNRLIGFTFLLYSISNLVAGVSSFGRFLTVANLFAVSSIIFYLHNSVWPKMIRKVLPFAYAGILFFLVVTIRLGFDTTGVMAIIGNPVTALFKDTEVELIKLIK
jgi:hypothetical protein